MYLKVSELDSEYIQSMKKMAKLQGVEWTPEPLDSVTLRKKFGSEVDGLTDLEIIEYEEAIGIWASFVYELACDKEFMAELDASEIENDTPAVQQELRF